ncbi:uncharacterized protein LOC122194018, partial [Lagopus leucura]|uniref:uncharacterized protein LOC122194018 n=1 Tax=Lagopus leucura TaxID=30410 RepID=UPI001C6802A3
MNGDAECPADLEMTAPKNQDRWSQEDMLTLLECMKNNLPSNDGSKFKTTESHLDWEKVAFKDFSGEMCKMKWMEISNEVRKFRTLTELIMDAEEHVKNPYKGKKLKKHPDFPKKPLTPYFRFFMEKRAKYAKLHPEMSNLDLTKILSKKYKELPEKKKVGLGDPAGSLCHVCLPAPRRGLQLSQYNQQSPAPAWLRCHPGVGSAPSDQSGSLPCFPGLQGGGGGSVCPSIRPFQTKLGGGFAVGWDVLGLTRTGWLCWHWDSHLGSVCHRQQRAGVQSPPCCSPTSGTLPGLPVGWDRRSGWVPGSRVGNPHLGAVLGLEPFR